MARLGETLGWGSNPLYQGLSSNRNALMQFGAGLASGPTFSQGIANGLSGLSQGSLIDTQVAQQEQAKAQETEQLNMTKEWLRARGRDDLIPLVDAGQGMFALQQATAKPDTINPTANMQDVDYLVGQGVDRDTAIAQVFGAAGGGSGQLGNTVYTLRDPQGNIVPAQVGQNGFVPSALPEGMTFDPGALNAERSAGSKYGAGVGQGALDLPSIEANAEFALRNLDGLIYQTDENSNVVTGPDGRPVANAGMKEQFGNTFGIPTGQYLPAIRGTEKANFQTRLDQTQGQAFLQALDTMKGSGAISEVEGAKGTQAIYRASTATTEADFIKAVKEARDIYARGLENARRIAGGTKFTGGANQQPNGPRTTSSGVSFTVDQ